MGLCSACGVEPQQRRETLRSALNKTNWVGNSVRCTSDGGSSKLLNFYRNINGKMAQNGKCVPIKGHYASSWWYIGVSKGNPNRFALRMKGEGQ